MAEHRAHSSPESAQSQPTSIAPKKKFSLSHLAQHYGVGVIDMMDFSHGNTSIKQTIDNEFLAYMTANFKHTEIQDNDILAF
jgi:hypothetical protein